MPSINLRLSEEEHGALRKWAFDSRRSLQKEIIWRLFAHPHFATAVEQAEKHATEKIRAMTGLDDLRAEFVTEPVLPHTDARFKPDPK